MRRAYTLKRRAEQQAQTRQRIVEAAVDLHSAVGPARTTFSMVAERAGVQRHTLYAHFPDERSLSLACSGMTMERDPPPDAATWRDIPEPRRRLQTALHAIYSWYERNEELLACVLRDAEFHELTKEMVDLRMGAQAVLYRETLSDGLTGLSKAMLALALRFHTWRTLVRDSGLSLDSAVLAMVEAVYGKSE